jgi:hypothetical protein
LDAHVFSEECEQHFTCYHCGRNFQTKADLIVHRKIEPEEKVKPCRIFSEGGFDFEDEDCWYIHSQSCQEKPLTMFTSSICEKVFGNRRECMSHRKRKHVQAVSHCNKASSGNCIFGEGNYWFLHGEKNKSYENENKENANGNIYNDEMIRKIFDMMDSFTHKIVDIERKTYDINEK